MKIVTLFTQGSYGTFISWCIYSFSELNLASEIISPFQQAGSGHGYRGSPGSEIVIPKHAPDDKECTNYVLIECEKSKVINYLNNQFEKQHLSNLDEYIETFFPNINEDLLKNWGGNNRWELRELLSFYLENMITAIKDQIDFYQQEVQERAKCYTISPENFLLNLPTELEKLLIFFGLKKHKDFDLIDLYLKEYLSNQRHFFKSDEIDRFIGSTVSNNVYTINNLTIFDEAYIQYKLRSTGHKIKCYNLNVFPKVSTNLHELLE